jgi:hypothetical protein
VERVVPSPLPVRAPATVVESVSCNSRRLD